MHLGLPSLSLPVARDARDENQPHQFAMFTGKAADYPKHLLVFIVLIYLCALSDEWQARRFYDSSFTRAREMPAMVRPCQVQ